MSMSEGVHVSVPTGREGPGVLVLHEAWGLTPDILEACERLADEGYVTLAPDLTGSMHGAGGAVAQIMAGRGPLLTRALDEVDRLVRRPEVTSDMIGVVGFSMGAALASLLDRHPATGAIGFNYGMVPSSALRYRKVPVVASFGGADPMLPRRDRPLLRRLTGRAIPHDLVVYEGVGHSFMTGAVDHRGLLTCKLLRIGVGPDVAGHAWSRLLTFLDRHVAGRQMPKGPSGGLPEAMSRSPKRSRGTTTR